MGRVIRHACVVCGAPFRWQPNSHILTCTSHRFEVVTIPPTPRKPMRPNTSCIVCNKPLYRAPWKLRTRRYAACHPHRGEAQQIVGRTAAQISAWELLHAKQKLASRKAAPPPPPVVALQITPSPSSVILREVSEKHSISVSQLKTREYSNPAMFAARSEAACRLREERGLTPGQIGIMLGGRDHTTIMRMIDSAFRKKTTERSKAYLRRPKSTAIALDDSACIKQESVA